MRKTGKLLLSLFLCLALALALLPAAPVQAAGDVTINATNFPDANFRSYVTENFDTDGNGKLSETEITKIKTVGVYNKNISSVKGIEFFTSMTYLSCGSNQLKTLDVSKNTALTGLTCGDNQLKTLDVSKNTALKELRCNDNQLTSLDVTKNTALTDLSCNGNQLTALNVSKNTALTYLSCENNLLKSLSLSANTALETLYCSGNLLTSLNLSKNTALSKLYCDNNQLTSLTVGNSTALVTLSCDKNQLKTLDVSKNTMLTSIYCSNNQLTALDVSNNAKLTGLSCASNQLSSLNVSNNTALEVLHCNSNQIKTLNVTKNTKLTTIGVSNNLLKALDLSKNTLLDRLSCASNQLTALDVSKCPALKYLYCYDNAIGTIYAHKDAPLTSVVKDDSTQLVRGTPTKPAITTQPKNVSVKAGETATFKVAASGANLKYQWYYQAPGTTSWTKVANNGTSATYKLTTAARHNGYLYTCKVYNDAGQVWSGNAKLTVLAKPTITTEPKSVSVKAGETATFKVAASGANLKYQWYYQAPGTTSWTKVANNGTSATYTLTTAARHNGYLYTCKVYNDAGQVWSGNAKLTVK
ncbi:MAG: immunoglobulin domain-containing protein [Oscillospiraceae bacterium]|nr:immunoglobulin domain-containing protein [Oscillospiraceae bacterium]